MAHCLRVVGWTPYCLDILEAEMYLESSFFSYVLLYLSCHENILRKNFIIDRRDDGLKEIEIQSYQETHQRELLN